MTAQPNLGFGPDDEDPVATKRFNDRLAAVRLAAKCFEIARSSAHAGERANAISRGTAIAKRAGLRLELFDIPGRDQDRLQMALRDVEDTLRRWSTELQAKCGETLYDARRRAFDDATRAAAERDRANGRRSAGSADPESVRRADLRDRWPTTDAALNALRARRVAAFPIDLPPTTMWSVPDRAQPLVDEWQLRQLADEVCA